MVYYIIFSNCPDISKWKSFYVKIWWSRYLVVTARYLYNGFLICYSIKTGTTFVQDTWIKGIYDIQYTHRISLMKNFILSYFVVRTGLNLVQLQAKMYMSVLHGFTLTSTTFRMSDKTALLYSKIFLCLLP